MSIKAEKCFVVLPTVVLAGKYWIVFSILASLIACAPVNSLSSTRLTEIELAAQNNPDHNVLARQYEKLAEEMQTKAEEQKEILAHKSYSSHFGKNRKNAKSQTEFKIRHYEQAALEYKEKAAHHRAMVIEEAAHQTAARPK